MLVNLMLLSNVNDAILKKSSINQKISKASNVVLRL